MPRRPDTSIRQTPNDVVQAQSKHYLEPISTRNSKTYCQIFAIIRLLSFCSDRKKMRVRPARLFYSIPVPLKRTKEKPDVRLSAPVKHPIIEIFSVGFKSLTDNFLPRMGQQHHFFKQR